MNPSSPDAPKKQYSMREILKGFIVIVILVGMMGGFSSIRNAFTGYLANDKKAAVQEKQPSTQKVYRLDRSEKYLKAGRPLPLAEEAKELLKLMKEYPDRDSYLITYDEEMADYYSLLYDTKAETITQAQRKYPSQSVTTIVWYGYLAERLKDAASGGSMDNTPDGVIAGIKSYGEIQKERFFRIDSAIKKDIRYKYTAGFTELARDMLLFIKENPGKVGYYREGRTDQELISFKCSFRDDFIEMQSAKFLSDGKWTNLRWDGDIIRRLENAANGGKL